MGDLEPLGVNFGPTFAQNQILKIFTVTQKIYSYSRKALKTYFNQKVGLPDKFRKQKR